jgi:hypothetical protein
MLDLTRTPARLTTRREFTLEAALALLSTVTIVVAESCGGGSPAAPSPAGPGDLSGTISANHGHTAIIREAQLSAGNAFTLDIRGVATHPHSVNLTQGDLTTLQNKQPVVKQSTNNDSHTHAVTFTP